MVKIQLVYQRKPWSEASMPSSCYHGDCNHCYVCILRIEEDACAPSVKLGVCACTTETERRGAETASRRAYQTSDLLTKEALSQLVSASASVSSEDSAIYSATSPLSLSGKWGHYVSWYVVVKKKQKWSRTWKQIEIDLDVFLLKWVWVSALCVKQRQQLYNYRYCSPLQPSGKCGHVSGHIMDCMGTLCNI